METNNEVVLGKMLEEIDYLQDFITDLDFETFMNSEDKRRVVSMTLINLGELVRHLSKDFKNEHDDVLFDDILGLRKRSCAWV